jgi:hypothetical protein
VLRPAPGPLPVSLANAVKPLLGEAATFRRLSADTLFFCYYFQQARPAQAILPTLVSMMQYRKGQEIAFLPPACATFAALHGQRLAGDRTNSPSCANMCMLLGCRLLHVVGLSSVLCCTAPV